jgi:hypothetical protein
MQRCQYLIARLQLILGDHSTACIRALHSVDNNLDSCHLDETAPTYLGRVADPVVVSSASLYSYASFEFSE